MVTSMVRLTKNVTKYAGNWRLGQIYLKIPKFKTSFFVQCLWGPVVGRPCDPMMGRSSDVRETSAKQVL